MHYLNVMNEPYALKTNNRTLALSAVKDFVGRRALFAKLLLSVITIAVTVAAPQSAIGQDSCSAVFSKAPLSGSNGARFLHERNGNLHKSELVEKSARGIQKPHEKLGAFLNRLEAVYANIIARPQHAKRAKDIILREFVIKESEIPDSYYQLQARIARERGHGQIEVTPEMRKRIAKQAIAEQEQSLRQWVDYFFSKDSNIYPMWTKYWALTSVAKLGKYDVELASFASRSKGHVSPFAELNREAFALTVDSIVSLVEKKSLADIKDLELLKRVETTSFNKIYGYNLKTAQGSSARLHITEGKWIKYDQGSSPNKLVKSLAGKGTGWCTAGKETAAEQLKGGDFYVYYSLDRDNKPTVPRLAIRMEDEAIGEIRGIGSDQNLDHEIVKTNILSQKLSNFGEEGARYSARENDMRRLTKIEKQSLSQEELSLDDLKFLYELDRKIEGFGYENDPRIAEILARRDALSDISKITGLKRDEISTTEKEARNKKIKYHYGDLELVATEFFDYGHIEVVHGSIRSNSTETLGPGKFPKLVTGDFSIDLVSRLESVELPEQVNGSFDTYRLMSAVNVSFPKLNSHLYFRDLVALRNVKFADTTGILNFRNLVFAANVEFGDAKLISLESMDRAEGVKFPEQFSGSIDVSALSTGEGITLPQTMTGTLKLSYVGKEDVVIKIPGVEDIHVSKYPKGFRVPKSAGQIIGK